MASQLQHTPNIPTGNIFRLGVEGEDGNIELLAQVQLPERGGIAPPVFEVAITPEGCVRLVLLRQYGYGLEPSKTTTHIISEGGVLLPADACMPGGALAYRL